MHFLRGGRGRAFSRQGRREKKAQNSPRKDAKSFSCPQPLVFRPVKKRTLRTKMIFAKRGGGESKAVACERQQRSMAKIRPSEKFVFLPDGTLVAAIKNPYKQTQSQHPQNKAKTSPMPKESANTIHNAKHGGRTWLP